MATNVVMPKMGESITEGTILRWLKKPGDSVKKDEPILEISTDKVDTEVPAPSAGVLLQQLVQEKETVAVGTPIAVLGESGEAALPTSSPKKAEPKVEMTSKNNETEAAVNVATSAAELPIIMPKMGESITEGTVLKWLKKAGDAVKKDEPILEISTDKVDTEVPSPVAGTITRLQANEKDVVPVGATLAYISSSTVSTANSSTTPPTVTPNTPKTDVVVPFPKSSPSTVPTSISRSNRFYSPLVKSIAKQEGISLSELDSIVGSGVGGRVNKNDMLKYVATRHTGVKPASKPSVHISATPSITLGTADQVIPMDNIRMKIAEHMVKSKEISAHVTSISEVDVTEIVKFREKFKDEFKQREGASLTYTPIFIDAMVKAIKDFPFINSTINGTDVVVKKDINFGVAVSVPPAPDAKLPPALIVPNIKRAQDLNVAGIARAVSDLASKARSKKLTLEDITGSTFTLTNPGMFGNLFGTPIINQPNVAIMTTGAVVKRVVVKTDADGNDYMVIRSMMYLGLSYDHRIIDGQYGVQFTERVKEILEAFTPSQYGY